jgi:hypothetical protein
MGGGFPKTEVVYDVYRRAAVQMSAVKMAGGDPERTEFFVTEDEFRALCHDLYLVSIGAGMWPRLFGMPLRLKPGSDQ